MATFKIEPLIKFLGNVFKIISSHTPVDGEIRFVRDSVDICIVSVDSQFVIRATRATGQSRDFFRESFRNNLAPPSIEQLLSGRCG